ncbi:probable caffeoyl-CoA O-methyltransferase 2 [Coccomyxa sp. Obi]|nr:probable caffeoyl-CoA O-methyltransferase 2 [Coccomyxa sp. Obi]
MLKSGHLAHCSLLAGQRIFSRAAASLHHLTASKGRAHYQRSSLILSLQRTASDGPINTEQLELSDRLYSYLLAHTPEPAVLRDLRHETALQHAGRERNQVAPEQGRFLAWLLETLGARRIIEVGVFTGYSSLAMALALPEHGCLVACEKDEGPLQLARDFWRRAGISHKIDERTGPAADSLEALLAEGGADSYDFAFIDADKRSYQRYFDLLLQLVRPGGVIVVDNVLWYGRVADPKDSAKNTVALREFNAQLLNDSRVSFSTVPIGDGIALCRRL